MAAVLLIGAAAAVAAGVRWWWYLAQPAIVLSRYLSPVFQVNVWPGDPYGVKLLGIWFASFDSSCTYVGGLPTTCSEGIFSPAYQSGGPDYDYPNIVLW